MSFESFLSFKNIKNRPVRSAALILLAAFLSFSVFAGSLIISALRNGLRSYESRLGADIIVVPYEARTKGTFESILVQGIPGNFYMDEQYYDKIRSIEGVALAAPEFYLASTSAGCCSVAVQIIGFDPEQDFLIRPWIKKSFAGELKKGDIIVGSQLNVPRDRKLTFYNTECTVAGQLEETGTGLDTAVYTSMETIRDMVINARSLGFHYFDKIDPSHAVSSVMIKVADGYDREKVAGDINIHVRKVVASQAGSMVSNVADGLHNVSLIIQVLTAMIWILGIVVLCIAFLMISHERRKEFAVLRVLGLSRKKISGLLLRESACISLAGSILGLAAAALILFPFSRLISTRLGLPYLLPGAGHILLLGLAAVLLSMFCCALSSALAAFRISRRDTGLLLREDL